jgi:hypothetical protein
MKKKINRWEHLEDQLKKQEEDKKAFNKKLEDWSGLPLISFINCIVG